MQIPNFDLQHLTDEEGRITQEAHGFFSLLIIALQKNLSNESFVTPQQPTTNINLLNSSPTNPNDYTGGLLYNSTAKKFMGNVNGTFQYFSTTPSGLIPGSDGGTGVDNNGFTLNFDENVSFEGGYDITMNTTGITDITFPTTGTLATTANIESTNIYFYTFFGGL